MRVAPVWIMLLAAALWTGCRKPYPGYSGGKQGIYYKLHIIGEEDRKARPGDIITVNIEYRTLSDSIFFQSLRKLQVDTPRYRGSLDACFAMLAAGDSASFILDASDFFGKGLHASLPGFLQAGDHMKINVAMRDIQTREAYNREKEAFLSWIEDFGAYEKVILKQYIATEKLDVSPLPSGIYYLNIKPGNGKKVEMGDTVTVHYEGRFLNGKFFDSTRRRNQPFQFVYGTEWQVVNGLEEGIGMMREGERSLFILPSDQGFGNRGSSTGTIPPFTSLIFEVEILKVSSPRKL
jgi:FKBP-type peptidyl-prolyl cis-trans isomerase FkpA